MDPRPLSPIVTTPPPADLTRTTTTDPADPATFRPILDLVLNAPLSASTRDRYRRKLLVFLRWWEITGRRPFSRQLVQEHMSAMQAEKLPNWDVAHALIAIKNLTREAAYAGLIDAITLQGILDIKSPPISHARVKNWLTSEEVVRLMSLADRSTLAGKRDTVALGFLLYCGLRRHEAVGVEFRHIQVVEGRPCIVRLMGKGSKHRDIPMPVWLFEAIQDWVDAAGIDGGRILRPLTPNGRALMPSGEINVNGLWRVVKRYAVKLGKPTLAPHDLRRTYAKLARKGGAELDQIQQTCGHASLTTTQEYIGTLDYDHAPCDALPQPAYSAG